MTVIYFLSTIILLIAIHEWGHFIIARLFGVGVRTFTIGFGKQIIAWVDPKTGTSWGIAPLPLGGYVGLLGEKKAATLTKGELAGVVVQGRPFMQAPLYAKLAILFAGPAVNLLFAVGLFAVLGSIAPNPELPVLAAPSLGSPAQVAGIQSGDVLVRLNDQPIQFWRELPDALAAFMAKKPQMALTLLVQRGGQVIPIVLSPKAQILPTVSLAIQANNARFDEQEQLGLRLHTQGLRVQHALPDSPAAKASLQANDVVMQVDGQVLDHPNVLFDVLKHYVPRQSGLVLQVLRSNTVLPLTLYPKQDTQGLYRIGLQFEGVVARSIVPLTAWQVLQEGSYIAYTASVLTVQSFGQLLLKPFESEQLAGPITIATMAKKSADAGLISVLAFIASLSISVGVLNLLPIPMLDGGQMVYHIGYTATHRFKMAFKIADKPYMAYFSQVWTLIGVGFVLMLTVLAIITDIKRNF